MGPFKGFHFNYIYSVLGLLFLECTLYTTLGIQPTNSFVNLHQPDVIF